MAVISSKWSAMHTRDWVLTLMIMTTRQQSAVIALMHTSGFPIHISPQFLVGLNYSLPKKATNLSAEQEEVLLGTSGAHLHAERAYKNKCRYFFFDLNKIR